MDWSFHENFKVEYTASSMLVAISSALGNSYRIHIKGNWTSNASTYMMLVGRPGVGKTPPLNAAFAPIRKADNELYHQFKLDMEAYQDSSDPKPPKPILKRTILYDFTPEAMMQAHYNNPRNITLLTDEIMGLFKSVNRYSSSPLVEQLLSAWSDTPIDVMRVGNPIPYHIEHPCINIVGSIQTTRMQELLNKGYKENGLLDRFLFVVPYSNEITLWNLGANTSNEQRSDTMCEWKSIVDKVLKLDYIVDESTGEKSSHILTLDKEATEYLFTWQNNMAKIANAIEDEAEADSRKAKYSTIVPRLSLIFQVMNYACGESLLHNINLRAVQSAVLMMDFYDSCVTRLEQAVALYQCDSFAIEMLGQLPASFCTKDAKAVGQEMRISPRTVANYLDKLLASKLIRKVKNGQYEKLTENQECK